MDKKYSYENYEVKLSKSDLGLLIQFDDSSSGTLFSKLITDQIAKDVSDQLLDAETIYQMLKDFFDNKPAKVTLSFTPDGKLAYSCPMFLGNIVRKTGFTINLDKENLDPLGRIERFVSKLSDTAGQGFQKLDVKMKSIDQLEQRFQRLLGPVGRIERLAGKLSDTAGEGFQKLEVKMKSFGQLEQRFQRLEDKIQRIDESVARVTNNLYKVEKLTEERYNKLEQFLTDKMSKLEKLFTENTSNGSEIFHFNPYGVYASHYCFSDENRTALSNKEGGRCSIFAKEPLPKNKRCTFSLIVQKKADNVMTLGIARNDALDGDCFAKVGAFACMFASSTIYLYSNGIQYQKSFPAIITGDKVSFTVHLETGEFFASLNGNQVTSLFMPKDIIQGYDFYPFIMAYGNLDSPSGATFV